MGSGIILQHLSVVDYCLQYLNLLSGSSKPLFKMVGTLQVLRSPFPAPDIFISWAPCCFSIHTSFPIFYLDTRKPICIPTVCIMSNIRQFTLTVCASSASGSRPSASLSHGPRRSAAFVRVTCVRPASARVRPRLPLAFTRVRPRPSMAGRVHSRRRCVAGAV